LGEVDKPVVGNLAKVGVAGSNPVVRSKNLQVREVAERV